MSNHQQLSHLPVLAREVMQCLQPSAGQSYLDLTAGFGGHAATIIDQTQAANQAVLVDRDQQAIAALKKRFGSSGVQIIHSDYLSTSKKLSDGGKSFDLILVDLGVSSPQLELPNRGFALSKSGPLDMRMDISQEHNAASLVNEWDEAELERIIRDYGEERGASLVARAIVDNRPIETTDQLAAIIERTVRRSYKRPRIHPATKTFQAIRIAVNNELEQLEQALPIWLDLLRPGGRLAVISFHSLEDRIVKNFFAEHGGNRYDAELISLSKKPITASRDELANNPRSRSAKLRCAAKLKQKQKGN